MKNGHFIHLFIKPAGKTAPISAMNLVQYSFYGNRGQSVFDGNTTNLFSPVCDEVG